MVDVLLEVVIENLSSLIQNEFATITGIRSKAEKLSNNLDLIKAVLEDAERKQFTDRSIKVWLQQLKDAVYVLDDILEECSIESHRLRGFSAFKPKNMKFRHEIGNKLKEIVTRFDEIAKSKNEFLQQQGVGVIVREMPTEVPEWRQTSSSVDKAKVYGREDDIHKIVKFLVKQAQGSDFLSIYPIVGLGGVGKTTLAQSVYNDQEVSSTFDIKLWVCISDVFSVKRILCSIIDSITKENFKTSNLDVIERKVQELLQGKKYLLVLDDVWNKNQEMEYGLSQDKWDKLKIVLSCGSKGSSILVSTRDTDVAEIMGTCQPHHLSGLSEKECWLLFKEYAFGPNREEQEELVAIGKNIVKKCKGLPLAAKALGDLMRKRSGASQWLEVEQSQLWTLPDENSILPALKLSYFYLTPTSKQCFSFCAIFPKDTRIKKEDLIHLWMANGFISSRENLEVEGVGDMIWNELCRNSFFQDIEMDEYGGGISFKMHDLVHDLAQSVMGSECMNLKKNNKNEMSEHTHHISFDYDVALSFNEVDFKKVESLRTFYAFNRTGDNHFCIPTNRSFHRTGDNHFCIPTNRSLRVLCASSSKLPSFKSFIHLRYLKLSHLPMETLPDSICSLKKLEVLELEDCHNLRCLPKHLSGLQNLRHLVIKDCHHLSHMFPYIGKLSCLRTLSVYIVKLEEGHSLAELHDLNLGGELTIEKLENVRNLHEAQEANLIGKKNLQILSLLWSINVDGTPATSGEKVLEVLQPHSNLKRLNINCYDGSCFPSWIGTLSNLVSLKLRFCENCICISPLGKIPALKELRLSGMHVMQYMDDGVEARLFPSLEKLSLKGLPNIERLLKVESGEMFPRLSNLDICYCPKLRLPCLPYVKYLNVSGCNNELLRSISSFYGLTDLILDGGFGSNEPMTSFPDGMFRDLTCLQTLRIRCLNKLKELPNELFDSENLKILSIAHCGELETLPDGIRHLTSLESLRICRCRILVERFKEGTGEEWDKIAHIPKLEINSRWFF